jgi:hypothetical protein
MRPQFGSQKEIQKRLNKGYRNAWKLYNKGFSYEDIDKEWKKNYLKYFRANSNKKKNKYIKRGRELSTILLMWG